MISFPPKMFTRAFNNDNCIIRVAGSNISYTGCYFEYDSDGWLTNVSFRSFGSYGIDINSTVNVNFSVTNSWAAYPFMNKVFTATVFLD
jgi:hypothetical protein